MKFKLRPWTKDDLTSLVKYANNPKIAANLTNRFQYPYTEKSGIDFIEMATSQDPPFVLCIEVDGQAAGGIGVHAQEDVLCKNMELGYWLAEPFWGKGIVTEAIGKMLEYGFQRFPVHRIYARPYGPNKASQRILQKNGFRLEGILKEAVWKNEQILDIHVYAILRSEYDNR